MASASRQRCEAAGRARRSVQMTGGGVQRAGMACIRRDGVQRAGRACEDMDVLACKWQVANAGRKVRVGGGVRGGRPLGGRDPPRATGAVLNLLNRRGMCPVPLRPSLPATSSGRDLHADPYDPEVALGPCVASGTL